MEESTSIQWVYVFMESLTELSRDGHQIRPIAILEPWYLLRLSVGLLLVGDLLKAEIFPAIKGFHCTQPFIITDRPDMTELLLKRM